MPKAAALQIRLALSLKAGHAAVEPKGDGADAAHY